jgi:DNA/RNA endonuclease G (NUC1)
MLVFISYRRTDSPGQANRIADFLRRSLGEDHVFLDHRSIELGEDFDRVLRNRLMEATAMIVVLGRYWLKDDSGKQRFRGPTDYVKREIESALQRGIPVVPVLVDGSSMPSASALPKSIAGFAKCEALEAPNVYFEEAMRRLEASLRPSGQSIAPTEQKRRSNYAVQTFYGDIEHPAQNAYVKVHNPFTGEWYEEATDKFGVARFHFDTLDLLQIVLRVPQGSDWRTTILPVWKGVEIPALNPVDLTQIDEKNWTPWVTGNAPAVTPVTVKTVSSADLRPARKPRVSGSKSHLRMHLPWGIPSAELVIAREAYVVGYDPERKLARWVGYRVQAGAPIKRLRDRFTSDPKIPAEQQADVSGFVRSGYDKGNLVRRADVTALGPEGISQAFYLSVIAPQASALNRFLWYEIEQLSTLESQQTKVWVLAGPAFLSDGGKVSYAVIANDVAVPTHFFRVMIREDSKGRLDARAFLAPNTPVGIPAVRGQDPEPFRVPISQIEQVTGLALLPSMPESTRGRIEGAIDRPWGVAR